MVIKQLHCTQAMPQTQHRHQRSRFRLSRIRGLWHRADARAAQAFEPQEPDVVATLIDSEPGTAILRRGNRLAEIIAAHDSGRAVDAPRRPPANPAFAEAVFVELMRAHQYRRAFDLLSPDCRRVWGSAEEFAAAQARGSMSRLRGVHVRAVRHLAEWTDTERGVTHREVAELDVEYTMSGAEPAIARVVHLVADAGKWRSLCYPQGTDR
ncbi:MAG: hypothetical protein JOZ75_13780 [Candidatus Dormibacteraeota bacterium]|nr:hypothetical protein [Candidatus Dormibacteraeota bacterium]